MVLDDLEQGNNGDVLSVTMQWAMLYCTYRTVRPVFQLHRRIHWEGFSSERAGKVFLDHSNGYKPENLQTCACTSRQINHLHAELYRISHLLALLGAHNILHVSRIRVKYVHYSFT